MKESLLKKEFKEKDVKRARNLINKDFTSKTSTGIGYSKSQIERKEGDVWEENGRTWTIKNGIKQTISKLKNLKKLYEVPLTCPKCSKSMRHHLDQKMYKIHKFCFDCTLEYEKELRKAGLYKDYEKAMITNSMKSFASDLESWVVDSLNESHDFVTEDGDIENWKNNSSLKEKTLQKLKEFQEYINSSI